MFCLQIYKYELYIANIVFECVNTIAPEVIFGHSRPQIANAGWIRASRAGVFSSVFSVIPGEILSLFDGRKRVCQVVNACLGARFRGGSLMSSGGG